MRFGAEPALIGYKPRARAVLRASGLVLKAYGARARSTRRRWPACAPPRDGPLRTGAFAGAVPELRLTAQRTVDGRAGRVGAPRSPSEAGALVADARSGAEAAGLAACAARAPARRRRSARRSVVAHGAAGSCARALDALLDAAAATRCRPALAPVPAHGDFHVDQLLRRRRHRGRRLRPDVPRRARARPRHLRRRRGARARRRPGRGRRGARPPARGLRRAAGGARLAPGRGDPRPRRPPVPPPGPGLAPSASTRCCARRRTRA